MSEKYENLYTSKDVKGVELGGALKNIIAFCAGTAAEEWALEIIHLQH